MLRSERLAGIGQMITGIAHESRNALQRIQSCTEMLELEIENNERPCACCAGCKSPGQPAATVRRSPRICRSHSTRTIEPAIWPFWREAWDLVETVRRDRDAVLVENVGRCRFKGLRRPFSHGAAISQFAGKLAGCV